ncbi:MAG TPA: lipopolysaccharide biosynthesis protein [bacterium]|nr:lipopolysaccharide biosynthesis protein [bacterium]
MRKDAPREQSLSQAAVRSLKWSYLGACAKVVSSLGAGIVLARLLGPQPFGQIAVATVLVGLGMLLADSGFGVWLIQRPTIQPRDIEIALTFQLCFGLILTAGTFFGADQLAGLFQKPEIAPVFRALSPVYTLQALGQVPASVLRRGMRHKNVQIAQIVSYVLGYLFVGVSMAAEGFGVWSLIAAQLCQSLANLVLLAYVSRIRWRLRFEKPPKDFFGFGGSVLASNIINWGIESVDMLLVSRFYGLVDTGLYNRSQALVENPVSLLVGNLQQVSVTTYARAAHKPQAVGRTLKAVLGLLALVVFPICLAAAAVPSTLVLGVLRSDWSAAAPIVVPLLLATPFFCLMAMLGSYAHGVGRPDLEFKAQMLSLGLGSVLLALMVRFGSFRLFAWAVAGFMMLRFLVLAVRMRGLADLGPLFWAKIIGRACGLGLAVAASAKAADALISGWGMPPEVRLSAVIVAAAASSGILWFALKRRLLSTDERWLLQKISTTAGVPARLAGALS